MPGASGSAREWDLHSRGWYPASPLYAPQETNAAGDPRPCETCGTCQPCSHAWQRQVDAHHER